MSTATTPEQLDGALAAAALASDDWAATSRAGRASALGAVADRLEAAAAELVAIAAEETHLTEARLRGELRRAAFQLRLFGDVLEEGGYLDVRIDHADPDWPMGAPRPDLRRRLEPLGPVLVFSASNFPFAFGVAGGDTAAALAAGCPVVVKAHSGHPALSARTGELVVAALDEAGAPAGTFAVVLGTESGRRAIVDPRIAAASFTGSTRAGRELFDLATSRPVPIPFYGELGSVNPVFVTAAASAARADEIADRFLASFTLGAGQFCTKPGVLVVPAGSEVLGALQRLTLPEGAPLLNGRIHRGYVEMLDELVEHPAVTVLAQGGAPLDPAPSPTLLATDADALLTDMDGLFRECFGPTALVVTYRDEAQLCELARAIDGQLTATLVAEPDDVVVPELVRLLARRAGRLLWNQWPTGVSVTYAQQHGGPYPATTAPGTTSVGTAAIARFLRPVAYQGFPVGLLPSELADDVEPSIPRRVNGEVRS